MGQPPRWSLLYPNHSCSYRSRYLRQVQVCLLKCLYSTFWPVLVHLTKCHTNTVTFAIRETVPHVQHRSCVVCVCSMSICSPPNFMPIYTVSHIVQSVCNNFVCPPPNLACLHSISHCAAILQPAFAAYSSVFLSNLWPVFFTITPNVQWLEKLLLQCH